MGKRNGEERQPFVIWLLTKIATEFEHNVEDKALARKALAAMQAPVSETAPLHAGYADDDEHWGSTIEEYVEQRLETDSEEWVVGFEFHVDHIYSCTEKWRVTSGPTLENPDAPIKVEKLAAAPHTAKEG